MAGHGGIVRPYGSTFLQFADYMRGSIRLSALMGLEVAWVYTHDSVGLGEDGPTHQPVEHLAALRAIPGLVGHPARRRQRDGRGVARRSSRTSTGRRRSILSRQDLPILPDADFDGVARGAYVAARRDDDARGRDRRHRVGAVASRIGAAELLTADGVRARVVSMPLWELFAAQDDAYRDAVLPPGLPVGLRRGRRLAWAGSAGSTARWRSTASAPARPAPEVLEKLGITGGDTPRRPPRELLRRR